MFAMYAAGLIVVDRDVFVPTKFSELVTIPALESAVSVESPTFTFPKLATPGTLANATTIQLPGCNVIDADAVPFHALALAVAIVLDVKETFSPMHPAGTAVPDVSP